MSMLSGIFGCPHRRTTFPITRSSVAGAPLAGSPTMHVGGKETYMVCLNCGKEIPYNWNKMRVGRIAPAPIPGPAPRSMPERATA